MLNVISRTFFLSYSKFNACRAYFFCQINYATKLSFILPPKDKIIDGATETEEGPNTLNYIFMLHFPENWGEGAVVMSGMQQGGRQGGQPPPQILANQLTLSRPGGHIIPTQYYLPPPGFLTLAACLNLVGIHPCIHSLPPWLKKG